MLNNPQLLDKTLLFESVNYGLFRKLGSYELDFHSRGCGASLRIELLQHVREKNRFRARIRELVLEVEQSAQGGSRSLLVEYSVLHDSLSSFSAQTENEAFEYIIIQVMKNTPCTTVKKGGRGMTFKEAQEKYQQWRSLKNREAEAQRLGQDGVVKDLFGRAVQLQREIIDGGWPDPHYVAQDDGLFR